MRRFFGFVGSPDDDALEAMADWGGDAPDRTIVTEVFSLGLSCFDEDSGWLYLENGRCLAVAGIITWPEDLGPFPAKRLFQYYLSRGIDFVQELDGQFSLFIRDDDMMMLYRSQNDGVALYHAGGAERLVFASRVRRLCAHPEVDIKLRPQAVLQMLTLGSPMGRGTMFESIQRLQSGEWLLKRKLHPPRINSRLPIPTPVNQGTDRTDWLSLFKATVQRCVEIVSTKEP